MSITDNVEARELELFTENHAGLYETRVMPCIHNLARKVVAGTYDHSKAAILWGYVADAAAQQYTKEHGGSGHGSYGSFSKAVRQACARELADSFAEQVANSAADMIGPVELSVTAFDFDRDFCGNPTAHYSVGGVKQTRQRRQVGYDEYRMEGAGWAIKKAGYNHDWYRMDTTTHTGDRLNPAGITAIFRRMPIVVGSWTEQEPGSWEPGATTGRFPYSFNA